MKPGRPLIIALPPHLSDLIRLYAERLGRKPEDCAILALMVRFSPEVTAAEFADEARK